MPDLHHTVDRSSLYLLSGNEFNSNRKSSLIRITQLASGFSLKFMSTARFFIIIWLCLKDSLEDIINENNEEAGELRKKLAEVYSREYSALVLPTITGITLISL